MRGAVALPTQSAFRASTERAILCQREQRGYLLYEYVHTMLLARLMVPGSEWRVHIALAVAELRSFTANDGEFINAFNTIMSILVNVQPRPTLDYAVVAADVAADRNARFAATLEFLARFVAEARPCTPLSALIPFGRNRVQVGRCCMNMWMSDYDASRKRFCERHGVRGATMLYVVPAHLNAEWRVDRAQRGHSHPPGSPHHSWTSLQFIQTLARYRLCLAHDVRYKTDLEDSLAQSAWSRDEKDMFMEDMARDPLGRLFAFLSAFIPAAATTLSSSAKETPASYFVRRDGDRALAYRILDFLGYE